MATWRTLRQVVAAAVVLGIVLSGPWLLAQMATAATGAASGVTSAAQQETQEWGATAMWAIIGTLFLQWLKSKAWFPALSATTSTRMQQLWGLLLASMTALGVHASFDAATGVLTISGLLFPDLSRAIFEIGRQWAVNEFTYRAAVRPPSA